MFHGFGFKAVSSLGFRSQSFKNQENELGVSGILFRGLVFVGLPVYGLGVCG